jgi:hypothetical protein
LHAGGLGDLNRACPEILVKKPTKMSRSDSEPIGELFHAARIESSIVYQA